MSVTHLDTPLVVIRGSRTITLIVDPSAFLSGVRTKNTSGRSVALLSELATPEFSSR